MIVVTAATDPAKLRALAAVLPRDQIDEWRWWLVFGEREHEVLALATELGVTVDSFPGPAGCAARYHRLCVTDGEVYVRLDEGISSLSSNFLEVLVHAATAPGVLLAHANVAEDEAVQAELARGAADPVTSLSLGMQAYAWQGRHFARFGGYATAEPRSLLRDAASTLKMRVVIEPDARCGTSLSAPEPAPAPAPAPEPAPEPAASVVAETAPAETEDAQSTTAADPSPAVATLVEAPPAPRKRRVTRRNVVNAA